VKLDLYFLGVMKNPTHLNYYMATVSLVLEDLGRNNCTNRKLMTTSLAADNEKNNIAVSRV